MKINMENNNTAILKELGSRIKRNRIDMQISQKDFAEKAGISTRTLSVAENGGDIRAENLIRILRVLGYIENLNLLLPELAFNPEDYRVLGKERQRVVRKSDKNEKQWKWGDET
ncbi:MAG: helix-turn-helix domain-containing protein [Ruminococcus sp.]|nr:helix-turn-helix domain-containing protein [Ruminococcus sp.]